MPRARKPCLRPRLPAQESSDYPDYQYLKEEDDQHGEYLAGDQATPPQRGGREKAKNAVAPVKSRGNALASEGGGHGT
ncbi:hypothetical protein StoSoilB13_07610 [Arthrobacter sp. StoSoilB13]|nr:hypothetical protein StoSoilB13_07610 [Arthrobacter sp. StoSoilB13]